jgi:2-keto-4-pentenoate hydratase/2-oxohepta-3-ene-1,7-dioic acid hydratase in catechol pathway
LTSWVRFRSATGRAGFGAHDAGRVREYAGDMFDSPTATDATLAADTLSVLAPCVPSKIVALWNNFHALAAKIGKPAPAHPLYLIKPSTSVIGNHERIERPLDYAGKIAFEGELGIVIGRSCHNVSTDRAGDYIFGYTCVNDVTAIGVMNENADFTQWCRAKGYDTFGCLGPSIATDLEWRAASVVTRVDGVERQRYALSDMIFAPEDLVSLISRDMSLLPGDVIACGTSIGVGSMPDGATVEVTIDGIGCLANTLGPADRAATSA